MNVNNRFQAKRKSEKKVFKERRKLKKLEKLHVKEEGSNQQALLGDNLPPTNGRSFTLSIALPGSILDNAQSPELRTYLAGQVARACVIFQVDEIIIFNETTSKDDLTTSGEFTGVGRKGNCNVQFARILQYLECPQYLRKSFFPKHPDLQYAGLLNPLDCVHHMRENDVFPFREGVVLDRPIKPGRGSFVNCGTCKLVQIDKVIQPNVRVTVEMFPESEKQKKYIKGKVVPPEKPRTQNGHYWGYTIRLASSLSNVISQCPFQDTGKYDVTIGTSERGETVDNVNFQKFSHCLIVFGGVKGLEESLEADQDLLGVDDPRHLFDHYINTCPSQGSRTIRTEEAILVSLSILRPKLLSCSI